MHPIDSVEFLIESGIAKSLYNNGQNIYQFTDCIKTELTDLLGKKKGAAAKSKMLQVIDKAVPDMITSLGAATGGISEASIEAFNSGKVAFHLGYLFDYFHKKDFQNIGYEMGAIAFDISQAVEGQSSVSIKGETFNFASIQQRRSLAQWNHTQITDEEITKTKNTIL